MTQYEVDQRSILNPEFSWHRTPTKEQLSKRLSESKTIPPLRRVAPLWVQRLVGHVHLWIKRFSGWYCDWYGYPCLGQVWPLPFGLILKHSDGTRIEEVVATRAAYDAGTPVPRVISYGSHPTMAHAPLSILMTRVPGYDFSGAVWDVWGPEERKLFARQLREILAVIRRWGRTPESEEALISSIVGTSIRSVRVPYSSMPPCKDEAEFNQRLIEPAHWQEESLRPDFGERLARVADIDALGHDIVFTHGDLAIWNLMVEEDGRIAGLIDWEAAGYYPAYWEYTTALQLSQRGWWYDLIWDLADGKYKRERVADLERWNLASGTML